MKAEDLLLTEAERKPIFDAWVESSAPLSEPFCRAQAAKVLAALLREARSELYDEWHFINAIITETGLLWPLKETMQSLGTPKVYSGERSRRFWERVNALPQPVGQIVYLAGCGLQELEERVWQMIEAAEGGGVGGCGGTGGEDATGGSATAGARRLGVETGSKGRGSQSPSGATGAPRSGSLGARRHAL